MDILLSLNCVLCAEVGEAPLRGRGGAPLCLPAASACGGSVPIGASQLRLLVAQFAMPEGLPVDNQPDLPGVRANRVGRGLDLSI